mmetsp:Transcript_36263/g.55446  ORF Transcript_36263/g.55446 Transcript_36263/m.55446 type:complete len:100 (-) Transcript_36263:730-1029(-)
MTIGTMNLLFLLLLKMTNFLSIQIKIKWIFFHYNSCGMSGSGSCSFFSFEWKGEIGAESSVVSSSSSKCKSKERDNSFTMLDSNDVAFVLVVLSELESV